MRLALWASLPVIVDIWTSGISGKVLPCKSTPVQCWFWLVTLHATCRDYATSGKAGVPFCLEQSQCGLEEQRAGEVELFRGSVWPSKMLRWRFMGRHKSLSWDCVSWGGDADPRCCCHYLDKGGVLSGSCTRYQGKGELRHCHLSCFREGGASGAQGCLCCHRFNNPERVELPPRSLLLIVNTEFLSVLSVGVINNKNTASLAKGVNF